MFSQQNSEILISPATNEYSLNQFLIAMVALRRARRSARIYDAGRMRFKKRTCRAGAELPFFSFLVSNGIARRCEARFARIFVRAQD